MCVKLTAAGVISCRGEIDVCEKLTAVGAISCRGDFGVCVKLTAVGGISCRGGFDVCEIDSSWCGLLSRKSWTAAVDMLVYACPSWVSSAFMYQQSWGPPVEEDPWGPAV